ncbi:MAG: class I SAM-dependent methyltransferase, partial [Terrimicrobiaceae bacterium]|nr:class I SAM-dependent methyltransferase [Terrimicrobiaceae bacterium]
MNFQTMVFALLRPMRAGRLELVLPDGRTEVFGGLGGGCHAKIVVRDKAFFRRCVLAGPIGFAESYIAGEWETPGLAEVIAFFILNSGESAALETPGGKKALFYNVLGFLNRLGHALRPNSLRLSRRNIREHYDLSNEFFKLWLDPGMTYSSALFEREGLTLEEAQSAKYERLCRKLAIQPHHHVLEIGTGWGGFAVHAASHHGCRVTTTTISKEQFASAASRIEKAGLSGRVTVLD